MSDRRNVGDSIEVGDITQSQGIAIGREAYSEVSGNVVVGTANYLEVDELKRVLEDLYESLDQLPLDMRIRSQMATGTALSLGIEDGKAKPDVLVRQLQVVGDTIKQTNVMVEEGSSLWNNVRTLSTIVAPVVTGGARVVAAWFGVTF